jgi:stage V sporulation protein R
MSSSAIVFLKEIGFGLKRKQEALKKYIDTHLWFKEQKWEDEIVAIERRRADVYDISVEETHRYAGQGFINHNSYWHSKIMTTRALKDSEVIDYADHHSGTLATSPGRLNPYKLGIELFRDIEERWDKGKFGKEYEECDSWEQKKNWDKKLGLGRQKIFEVRKLYNDVMFLDEFLTEDFCRQHKIFTYEYNEQTGLYEISSRDFKKIKEKLLFSLTNLGQPFIYVVDANYANRGELYLVHRHEGIDLKIDYAKDVIRNIYKLWGRPVNLETTIDETKKIITFDGEEHYEEDIN